MMTLCTPTLHPFDMFPAIDDLMRHARLESRHQRRVETAREPSYSYQWEESGGTLEVEMPGVRKEDISVEVEGRNLRVTGKRHGGVSRAATAKRAKVTGTESDASGEEGGKLRPNGGTEGGGSNVVSDGRQTGGNDDVEKSAEKGRDVSAGDGEEVKGGNADGRSGVTVYKCVFRLSDVIDPEGIEVERYRDGVLQLRLRRRERAGARKIAVE